MSTVIAIYVGAPLAVACFNAWFLWPRDGFRSIAKSNDVDSDGAVQVRVPSGLATASEQAVGDVARSAPCSNCGAERSAEAPDTQRHPRGRDLVDAPIVECLRSPEFIAFVLFFDVSAGLVN